MCWCLMPYYVYILPCNDGSYYAGYKEDVDHRIEQHKKGQGSRIARIHEVLKAVYKEKYGSRSETTKRERDLLSQPQGQTTISK